MVGSSSSAALTSLADGLGAGAELAQDGDDDAVVLLEQRGEQVLGLASVWLRAAASAVAACSASWDLIVKRSSCIGSKISVGGTEIIAEDRRRFQSVVLRVVAAAAAACRSRRRRLAAVVVDGGHRGRDGGRAPAGGVAVGFGRARFFFFGFGRRRRRSGCAWRSRAARARARR